MYVYFPPGLVFHRQGRLYAARREGREGRGKGPPSKIRIFNVYIKVYDSTDLLLKEETSDILYPYIK